MKINFKTVVLYLWQLPQNIAGLILTSGSGEKEVFVCNDGEEVNVCYKNCFGAGVSLGNYIVLDPAYKGYLFLDKTVNHEHGHQKQSRILGLFYLLLIGLPSALGNIYDRKAHRSWSALDREKWYYNQLWEKWADKLGGVER